MLILGYKMLALHQPLTRPHLTQTASGGAG